MRRRVGRTVVAPLVFLILAAAGGCQKREPAAAAGPAVELRIGTVFGSGSWHAVGTTLAGVYSRQLTDVRVVATSNEDLEKTIDELQHDTLQLAIDDVETAYVAFSTGTPALADPHRALRAIAVLFSTAVHVVARSNTGIATVADFKGKRVGMGAPGSSTERAARLILKGHGLDLDQITPVPLTTADTSAAIREGRLDAAFIYAPFQNPVVANLTGADDVRLVAIQRSSLGPIQDGHHFLKSTTIPGGTYRNQEEDVLTVGMDVLLLCRQTLPDALVYNLTRTLFEAVPVLRQAHPSAAGIDPDRGPATAIPLHPGAARYYRERELLR